MMNHRNPALMDWFESINFFVFAAKQFDLMRLFYRRFWLPEPNQPRTDLLFRYIWPTTKLHCTTSKEEPEQTWAMLTSCWQPALEILLFPLKQVCIWGGALTHVEAQRGNIFQCHVFSSFVGSYCISWPVTPPLLSRLSYKTCLLSYYKRNWSWFCCFIGSFPLSTLGLFTAQQPTGTTVTQQSFTRQTLLRN